MSFLREFALIAIGLLSVHTVNLFIDTALFSIDIAMNDKLAS